MYADVANAFVGNDSVLHTALPSSLGLATKTRLRLTHRFWVKSDSDSAHPKAVEVQALLYEATLGIGALHSQGYIHMDLKPENIMLNCKGEKCSLPRLCYPLSVIRGL